MTNIEKYNNAFVETFSTNENELSNLSYQSISAWDSVGHMALIASLEEAFDLMMETDDIIDFSSYIKGFEIAGNDKVFYLSSSDGKVFEVTLWARSGDPKIV